MKAIVFIFALALTSAAFAVPQIINYQGELTNPLGIPLDTTVSITFNIYSASSGGTPIWSETHSSVTVTNGLFKVSLGSSTSLADMFYGNRWLGVTVGNNSEMSPREQFTSVAHAYRAGTVDGASGGVVDGTVVFQNGSVVVGSGNDGDFDHSLVVGSTNEVYGSHSSVAGGIEQRTDSAYSFIGGGQSNRTSGSLSVVGGGELNVSGTRSFVGGGTSNTVTGINSVAAGGVGNIVGGASAFVGSGRNNRARGNNSVVVGGGGTNPSDSCSAQGANSSVLGGIRNNAVSEYSSVCGGRDNDATGGSSFIGGGVNNSVSGAVAVVGGGTSNSVVGAAGFVGAGTLNVAESDYDVVCGGHNNHSSGTMSTIGGGENNVASGHQSTVGGGGSNSSRGHGSTLSGGINNVADSSYSAVGGGFANLVYGTSSCIPGGQDITITGDSTIACGSRISTAANGAFVFSDGTGSEFTPGANRTFNAKASGGVRFYTNTAATIGAQLQTGQSAWVAICDSTKKNRFGRVNTQEILEKVAKLGIETWSYKDDPTHTTHIGPMAQDFYAQFGVGESDTTISTLDPDGVALAAIQELAKQNEEIRTRNTILEKELAALREQVQTLMDR
ncbi:MAG: hypothetical protein H6508_01395 [Calditrichaeota bacterium]|nr:hypothetical protein [Calditrichota bacterium]MCB9365831.1 hypothetical protein [Calditrichota bacterium]